MAAGASEATQHVLRCLHTLVYSIDTDARNTSEQQLQAAIGHEGYTSLLATLSTDGRISDDLGVRQLAAVILKQVIKKHWSAEAPKFEAPELSANERAHIKAVLPAGLAQESSKLRTAVAMCIAAIAKSDPDGWSGLVENLVGAIHTQRATNKALVHGAIRCLALLSDDIDEQQLPQVAQALLPELLAVASDASPGTEELRAAALSILCDLLKSLGVMAGVYQRQVRDLLVPLVEPWLPLLCAQVAAPLDVEDAASWSTRMLCLRCLTQLVSFFSKPLQAHMQSIMGACWRMYTQSLPLYTTHLVLTPAEGGQAPDPTEDPAGASAAAATATTPGSATAAATAAAAAATADGGGAAVDAEGNTLDPESLLAQLFELLMALVGLHRYAKLIKPALPEMAHLAVAYMQMTSRQAADWAADAAAYVADEDDSMFTVRVSGELLADSLMQAFGLDAAGALMDAVERRAAEAAAARAAGQAGWWKLREAALLAAGCCAASFPGGLPGEDGGGGMGGMGGGGGGGARQRAAAGALVARLQRLMDEVVALDLRAGACNPLLVGRALWLAARLQPLLRPDQRPALLQAAAAGLNSTLPPPVKIGACRALASLVGRVPPAVLSGPGPQGAGSPGGACLSDCLYGGCVALLAVSGEDSLNLVLESLVPLIKADPAAAARALPALAPPVLAVWSRHVSDPLIAESALEVLAALARVPACLGPLAAQALPVLAGVVRAPAEQPDGLVAACLGLLARLVRPGRREVVAAAAGAVTGPLLALLPGGAWAAADDSSGGLAHAATELLVELLRAGREETLVWAAPSLPPAPGAAATGGAAAGGAAAESPAAAADRVWAALLGSCHRLLDPRADEYTTALAGDLAYALVSCLPSRAAQQPALGALLGACAAKLAASNLSPLVGGLITALSAMAVAGGAAGWVDALAGLQLALPAAGTSGAAAAAGANGAAGAAGAADGQAASSAATTPTTTTVSALQAVLPIMLERQGCVRGRLASKTACLALLELLGSRHPLLGAVMVRGRRQDLSGGVRTRKQAAAAGGEQWTQVPAAVKMVAVVAELLVEQPWAQGGDDGSFAGEDDDDEDGSFFADDEEEDDEDDEEGSEEAAEDADLQSATALSLSGKGINQQEQAHMDAHINRSRTPAADSALVTGGAADPSGGAASASAAAAAAAGAACEGGPRDPIADLDLRVAAANTLRALRSGADTAPLLALAMELLPPRRQQQVAEALQA